MKYLLFLTFSFLLTCGVKNTDQIINSNSEQSQTEETGIIIEDAGKCFPERKIVSILRAKKVNIIKKGDKFFCAYDNTHLEVCELPEAFKKEGTVCTIEGEILEIFANERRMGTPFRLRKIK